MAAAVSALLCACSHSSREDDAQPQAAQETKNLRPRRTSTTAGSAEYCRLYPEAVELTARLDTGSVTCSCDARDIVLFQKEGRTWVRFVLMNATRAITLERELVGMCRIKNHVGILDERPLVRMELELGSFRCQTEVNLTDRRNFAYPLLLGRKFLSDAGVIVDARRAFILPPRKRQPEEHPPAHKEAP